MNNINNNNNKYKKSHILKNNSEFINWLKSLKETGYTEFINIEELQELVDKISTLYEKKYQSMAIYKDITKENNDKNTLLNKLSDNQQTLLKCGYRAQTWIKYPSMKKGNIIKWNHLISIEIKRKHSNIQNNIPNYFTLHADYNTGKITDRYELNTLLKEKNTITLDNLLYIYNENYKDVLDFSELEEIINNHNIDIELRHKILYFVLLKLLDSKKINAKIKQKIIKKYINDFNKELNIPKLSSEINPAISSKKINETSTKNSKILIKHKINNNSNFNE